MVALVVLLAGLRLLGVTRRMPRRRIVAESLSDSDSSTVVVSLPKPRYVIDDDDDDDDEDL